MQYEGKITHISDVVTVGQNNLEKRTVVLEEITDREFKGSIAFDLIKDKTNLIDPFKVDDIVKVSLNFRTNYSEKADRYFTSISGWRIDAVSGASSSDNGDEDLPF